MTFFSIDLVSDVHIDQWDESVTAIYPCGECKNFPLKWEVSNNKILIVAGDVSDDLDKTIKYLDHISAFYDYILFVDGNHEHVNKFPELYSDEEINNKITNPKIIYLPCNDFIYNDVVFIGCCGWWDYEKNTKINENINYFKKWIKTIDENGCLLFMNNCIEKSNEHYEKILEKLEKYKDKKIVIVTHTVPRVHLTNILATGNNSSFNKIKNKIKI